jgi:hypothetical protein
MMELERKISIAVVATGASSMTEWGQSEQDGSEVDLRGEMVKTTYNAMLPFVKVA